MNCNRWLTALLLLVVCLCLASGTAAATAPSVSGEEQAIAAQLARDNAAKAVPSIPPLAGGIGLAALLIFGAITSRRQRTQEEAGYDPILEDRRIGDPYRRLASAGKRRRRR